MKKYFLHTVLSFCLVVAMASIVHAEAQSMSPDEKAIADFMNKDMSAAWKSNKPGKVLELFSDSMPIVWLNPRTEKPITSKAEQEKELKAFFAKYQVMDFTAANVTVTKISDDIGFVTCTQKLLVADIATKKENEFAMQTVYEVVKEKDGKWRAYRELAFVGDVGN